MPHHPGGHRGRTRKCGRQASPGRGQAQTSCTEAARSLQPGRKQAGGEHHPEAPAGGERAGVLRKRPSAGGAVGPRSGSASPLPSPHLLALPQNSCMWAPSTGAARTGLQTRRSLRMTVALAAAPWKKGQGRKANPGQMLTTASPVPLPPSRQPACPLPVCPRLCPASSKLLPPGASLATVWTQRTQLRVGDATPEHLQLLL